jgi:two-component system response regulator YesN
MTSFLLIPKRHYKGSNLIEIARYCIVLSDVRMPSLSGMQLAREVKDANPDVKVILMTAFEIKDNEFSKVILSTQIDGFVQKPFRIKDLTDKVLDLMGETKRSRSE